jgi:hypothetical protein
LKQHAARFRHAWEINDDTARQSLIASWRKNTKPAPVQRKNYAVIVLPFTHAGHAPQRRHRAMPLRVLLGGVRPDTCGADNRGRCVTDIVTRM